MRRLTLIGLAAFVALSCPHSVAPQTHHGLQSQESPVTYNSVVDRVFEFSRDAPPVFRQFQRRIVLRFLPAWGHESQIVVLDKGNRVFRLVRYRLKERTPAIHAEYDRILHSNAKASVEDIVQRIECEKLEQPAGDSLVRLIEALSQLTIPTNLSTDVTLDGTTYELWIQTTSNEIHAVFSDGAYGDATDSIRIIEWIKSVQAEMQERD